MKKHSGNNLLDLLKNLKEIFKGYRLEVNCIEEIVAYVIKKDLSKLFLEDLKITNKEEKKILKLLHLRALKKIPLDYLLEKKPFYDCQIFLNRHVLIPRVETEELVDRIILELSKDDLKGKTLFDLCTGSGCIAIAIKKKFPLLRVIASDSSSNALKICRKNAKLNEVDIEIIRGDLLTPFKGVKADYIVSNPPYVSKKEYEKVSEEVKKEPKRALLGGDDGLKYYKKFSKELKFYLNTNGKIFFEIGYLQKEALTKLFSSSFSNLRFYKDSFGKDRFFFLEIEHLS